MTRDADAARGATAVVPLRDGVSGKSRLAAVLDAASRRRLVRVLARHVVATLLATDGIDRVVVVTADPSFARETLAGLAVEVLAEPADRPGLNAALEHARDHVVTTRRAGSPADGEPDLSRADTPSGAALSAAPRSAAPPSAAPPFPGPESAETPHGPSSSRPGRLLVAHADLPALTPADVAALLAEDAPVVIATDRNRSGTNLLLLPLEAKVPFETETDSLSAAAEPSSLGLERKVGDEEAATAGGRFWFRFGVGSLAAHLREAERHGLGATVVHRPGTAVDLDTADDWSQLPGEVRDVVGQQVPGLM